MALVFLINSKFILKNIILENLYRKLWNGVFLNMYYFVKIYTIIWPDNIFYENLCEYF